MVEKWKAQEIVQYLEEQLSNSLFHKNPEAMKMDIDVRFRILKRCISMRKVIDE